MLYTKKIENEKFSAEITVRIPKYMERIKLIKEVNFAISSDGKLEQNSLDSIEKMAEIALKYIEKISIKVGQNEFSNLSDLEYYQEYSEIVNEVIVIVLNGIPLGN